MTATAAPAPVRPGRRPLSALEEAMWVGWQLDPERWLHVIPLTFAVRGDLDLDRFRDAVDTLCARHPALGGRVVDTPDGPRLCWGDAPGVPFAEHRVDTAEAVPEAVGRARSAVIDVGAGPLTRIAVVHGPGTTTVVLTVHHLAIDGASIPYLVDELSRAHRGDPLGAPPDPEPQAAYARRSWDLAIGQAGEPLRRYWRDTLAGEVTARTLPAVPSGGGRRTVEGPLPAEVEDRVRRTAAELGVTWFTVLLGALFVVLHRYTGEGDLVVSTPYHGRSVPSLTSTIGSFANTLPVRERVGGAETYAALLLRLRASLRGALAHGDLPLPAILRAADLLGPEARARTHEVVLIDMDTTHAATVDVRHLDFSRGGRRAELDLVDLTSASDQRLAVLLHRDGDGCRVVWQDHHGDLEPELLAALARDHGDVVADMAAAPDRTVGEGLARLAPPPAAATRTDPPDRTGPPDRTAEAPERGRTAAPSETVAALAAVWRDVLGVPAVAADDSFFALGGHSLLATRLTARITERLGVAVSVRDLLTRPVLADLAALVAARGERGTDDGSTAVPAAPGDAERETPVFPASRFQEGIWLAERLDPAHACYAIPLQWVVTGELDPDRLAGALAMLVARHEILRTRFVEDDGELRQEVGPPWAPALDREDLAGLDEAARRERAERWSQEASATLNPANGRALRAALFTTGPDGGVLCLCAHHLVLDGESIRLLLAELGRCYDAASGGPTPPPPAYQYRDVVAAERAGRSAADLEYWRERLDGAPGSLPVCVPDEPGPPGAVPLPLAPGAGPALLPARIEHRASPFVVEATAVAAVLHRWTGLADLTFGVPVARHVLPGDGNVLGPSLNTLVLRSRCDSTTSLASLLADLRDGIVAAVEHQDTAFEDVVRALRPARERGVTPYVDVMLNHVGLAEWSTRLGPAVLTPVDFIADAAETSKFTMTITFAQAAHTLRGALAYRGDRIDDATAHRLAGAVADVLNRFVELLPLPLAEIDLDGAAS